jgi:hypothetical protein
VAALAIVEDLEVFEHAGGEFDSVDVRGSLMAKLQVGSSGGQTVAVRHDGNVLEYAIARLDGSTLIAESAREVSFSKKTERRWKS